MAKRNSWKVIGLIAPIIILYTFFILCGIYNVFMESLGYIPSLNMHTLSVSTYSTLFKEPRLILSSLYSLYIALTSTVLSTVLGIYLCYALINSKNKYLKKLTELLLKLGLILPYLFIVLMAMLLFFRSGIISRLLYNLNLIKDMNAFPFLTISTFGIHVIFVYTLKGSIFISLLLLNKINTINVDLINTAKTLGAKPKHLLFKIYIPLTSSLIVYSSAIVLAYDLGSFEAPLFLGTTRSTLSQMLYSSIMEVDIKRLPFGSALNIFLIILGIITILIYSLLLKAILRRLSR